MNIFMVDKDAAQAAQDLCDKHVVKMILESCQMLSTAHHFYGSAESSPRMYKAAFAHHPCTKWVITSRSNYCWLWRHAFELCNEYRTRFGPQDHKCRGMLIDALYITPIHQPELGFTTPAQAMPEQYKRTGSDYVAAYRAYYLGEKVRFATWNRGRTAPDWWVQATENIAE